MFWIVFPDLLFNMFSVSSCAMPTARAFLFFWSIIITVSFFWMLSSISVMPGRIMSAPAHTNFIAPMSTSIFLNVSSFPWMNFRAGYSFFSM